MSAYIHTIREAGVEGVPGQSIDTSLKLPGALIFWVLWPTPVGRGLQPAAAKGSVLCHVSFTAVQTTPVTGCQQLKVQRQALKAKQSYTSDCKWLA